jgi:IS5 family transposase
LTAQEQRILKYFARTRKLYVFLREHRHEIIDDKLQRELEETYRNTGAGKAPKPPAMMVIASIMQAYEGVSDARAVQLSAVDKAWQVVLGNLGSDDPAFSQGALFEFREKLIDHDLDRRILERTAELARSTKGFDAKKLPKTLRIAIDSSPLTGAGRVEDTINLIAHAANKVVRCIAELLDSEFEVVCRKAGIPLLLDSSIKKALDRDWSDKRAKGEAVDILARQVLSLERWIDKNLADEVGQPPLDQLLKTLREVIAQDLEPDPDGGGSRIIDGVAAERRISIEDGEMRHGRKSKSKTIKGYKRHIAADLDSNAIVACAITPANQPEHVALPELKSDIDAQHIRFKEAHFDRGYMGSPAVDEIEEEGAAIVCKPWRPHNTKNKEMFTKQDFDVDLRSMTITCPGGQTQALNLGRTVYFGDDGACGQCALVSQCTSAKSGRGRSMSIAEDEPRQERLRRKLRTKAGRQLFRERVPVEHRLAHIGQRQGNRARYRGVRKNLFDLRRAAAIQNLETTQRKAA